MLITALGHAGLAVESAGTRVLCDPWFSPEGAFQASWFPFPSNQHLLDSRLFEPDAILLSHEHLDHVDPWFLARVPAHVPVVIPQYPTSALRRKVLAAGPREVIEAPAWESVRVAGDLRVFFVMEESPMNHDAAMVVQSDGRTLLNMNDARLTAQQLRSVVEQVGRPVDVLALQAAGASWYPICYDLPPEEMRQRCLRKRHAKLQYVARVTRLVQPGVVVPFAGPPCFLDPELSGHNRQLGPEGIFPEQSQAVDWLALRGMPNAVTLLPGEGWNACGGSVRQAADPPPITCEDSRRSYLRAYMRDRADAVESVRERHPEPTASLWPDYAEHFTRLLELSPYFNARIAMRVGFDIHGPGGGRWAVDFRPGQEGVRTSLDDCQYVYRFASRWLPSLLSGDTAWEDFLLSLRFNAWRHPDLYNDHLLGLLKFASSDALDAVERFEAAAGDGATITVRADGRSYQVQRYCPHAGHDLQDSGAVMPGGVLVCLGHHYEFDLETGRCLNGHSRRLSTVPVPSQAGDAT